MWKALSTSVWLTAALACILLSSTVTVEAARPQTWVGPRAQQASGDRELDLDVSTPAAGATLIPASVADVTPVVESSSAPTAAAVSSAAPVTETPEPTAAPVMAATPATSADVTPSPSTPLAAAPASDAPTNAALSSPPTAVPTPEPTVAVTAAPTDAPPTAAPTAWPPTVAPTESASEPSAAPTSEPTLNTTDAPTGNPATLVPTSGPPTTGPTTATQEPSAAPTPEPVSQASAELTGAPTTFVPTTAPPTAAPTTAIPTDAPSVPPTPSPTAAPVLPLPERLQNVTVQATTNPLDVLVDPQALKLFYNGTEYFIKGVAYNPVPVGYKYVELVARGTMRDDTPLGFGGLCKTLPSPEVTDTGEVSEVSACYDSDYAKALTGGSWPNGDWFGEMWRRDFGLMAEMGLNSIRLYNVNPKNRVSCAQIEGYCDPRGFAADHRPMFKEAARHNLTVMWPLITQTDKALRCLEPDSVDPGVDLANKDPQQHLISPECTEYWDRLRGMVDEVSAEPNLLMWCYGNEDIASSKLLDDQTGEPTVSGKFRLDMANLFIRRIREHVAATVGRRIPITHTTFGSPGVAYTNLMKYLEVDVFGANPYGGAVGANNRPMDNNAGPHSQEWPHIEGLADSLQPTRATEWPGQIYLNWHFSKPMVATEWGNQPPQNGVLCNQTSPVGCANGCQPYLNVSTTGLTDCQEQAYGNWGLQWGLPSDKNPSDGAWVAQFYKGMLDDARMGASIGGYFFEWTDELYSKRDDWSQRALGLYRPVEDEDPCKNDGGSAGAGWGVDKLNITRAGEVALNGYQGNGLDLGAYSFRADPFELMGVAPLELDGQPRTEGPGNETVRDASRWGIPQACFQMERSAVCVSRRDAGWKSTLEAFNKACDKVDCSEVERNGTYSGCSIQQKATYAFNQLYFKKGDCDDEVATSCRFPPCGDAASSGTDRCHSPVYLMPSTEASPQSIGSGGPSPQPSKSMNLPLLIVERALISVVLGLLVLAIIIWCCRRSAGQRDERTPLIAKVFHKNQVLAAEDRDPEAVQGHGPPTVSPTKRTEFTGYAHT